MTHEYAGKYSAKHAAGTVAAPAISAALEQRADLGRVTCAAAFEVATALGVSAPEVGKTADLLEYRIIRCQLGLFGYEPEKRIVRPADEMSAVLRGRLVGAAFDDKISCARCWEIADELSLEKMAVSAACERLGLKVGPCQLGAF